MIIESIIYYNLKHFVDWTRDSDWPTCVKGFQDIIVFWKIYLPKFVLIGRKLHFIIEYEIEILCENLS